jgi:RNA polymerase sigma-70 factor (subfamily 1)
MSDPEATLIERARRQDGAAVEELLSRHLPGLRAFVRLRSGRLLREKESCSDLVQSVCREVLENLDRFQHGGENAFKQWLYRTALRKIGHRYDYWLADKRDPGRVRELSGAESQAADAQLASAYASLVTPSRAAMAREELARIESAFEQLSEDHREVIVLARILGLSHAEIAREMQRSEVAVRGLLFRALAHLSELL